jgi:hypothetical protein
MPSNRVRKLVCMVTAGMAVVLMPAVQDGSTASATGTPSASESAAARGKVRIELRGRVLGARGNVGRFTLSGALADRGRFVDDLVGLQVARTLYGAKGTIRMTVGQRGAWRITKGTKAYAGVRGRGREAGLYDRNLRITMTGTIWR